MIHRGDVWDTDFPLSGVHPAVVVTREAALPVLRSIAVVGVTSTVRGHPAEVPLGGGEGLDHESVANADELFTLPKERLLRYRGRLGPERLAELNGALSLSLGLS
jgi:mRNA interferase MazF